MRDKAASAARIAAAELLRQLSLFSASSQARNEAVDAGVPAAELPPGRRWVSVRRSTIFRQFISSCILISTTTTLLIFLVDLDVNMSPPDYVPTSTSVTNLSIAAFQLDARFTQAHNLVRRRLIVELATSGAASDRHELRVLEKPPTAEKKRKLRLA
ncbi:hypothetical protein B0T24DRAFT_683524 [Lasiosphaeria ovina]|uniref:Uncharacterized protein n=1 Tax=Lasiosphaeria ovina TaxID=92902 RepID=A0AAE0JVL4_9PEZI|nr:hypothetical protein B0T24DRAFT_683524 [Lasiosphaeria ovina]